MKLSKSKYCNGIQCKKMLWLDKNKPEAKEKIDNSSVLDNGNKVHEVARKLFGDDVNIEFNENLNIMINDTKKALLNENIIITEASFNYKDNFCSVDILKKTGTNYEMYEVKSSTKLKEVFVNDLAYQYYVLKSLGYNVVKGCVVLINSNYEKVGKLDLNKLFIEVDLTEKIKKMQNEVDKSIKDINEYMENKKEPKEEISLHCIEPYKCPFYDYCMKDIEKPNVFSIVGISNKKKYELYKDNKYRYKELMNEKISNKCKQQIDFELNNKEDYIDKKEIRNFLKTLSYPLYFLDFETFQMSIPEYDHIKPYEQIPFQYSLHYYESSKSKLMHKEFLAEAGLDPRRNIAESLVKNIPKEVCVLAYNMAFEKRVIKKLAELFPDLKEHLMNIYSNIKDLEDPFRKRDYYNKDMQGYYSIKYVLPALFPNDPNLDYHNLDLIHNGSEAMEMYANLNSYSKEKQENIKKCLLKYCELDTLAMVKIFDKLRNL